MEMHIMKNLCKDIKKFWYPNRLIFKLYFHGHFSKVPINFLIYFFVRHCGRRRETKILHSSSHPKWSRLGQTETRRLELHLGLLARWVTEAQAFGSSPTSFPGSLTGSCKEGRASGPGTKPALNRGRWLLRWLPVSGTSLLIHFKVPLYNVQDSRREAME